MPTRVECALFSANAYGQPLGLLANPLPPGWTRIGIRREHLNVESTGFRAHVYYHEGLKEIVIAFGGTHMMDRGDWSADWAIANGQLPRQYYNAINVYQRVLDYIEQEGIQAQITFTGHSLGGALAQYMAIDARGCQAITFGAPGILDALGALRGKYARGYSYAVVNHVARGDAFGHYGRHVGQTYYYVFDASDRLFPITTPSRILSNHDVGRYHTEFKRTDTGFIRRKVTPMGHVTLEECNWSGRVVRKIKWPPGF
jgi:pimeloyl-ACP methyl ester carboxylesterase